MPTADGPAYGDRLLYSGDDGSHFVAEPQPVRGTGCKYQPVTDQGLWAYCGGGMSMVTYRSTDGGAHFSQIQDEKAGSAPAALSWPLPHPPLP
jgi:hypothetical protein